MEFAKESVMNTNLIERHFAQIGARAQVRAAGVRRIQKRDREFESILRPHGLMVKRKITPGFSPGISGSNPGRPMRIKNWMSSQKTQIQKSSLCFE